MTTYAEEITKLGGMSDGAKVRTAIACAAAEAYVPVELIEPDAIAEIVSQAKGADDLYTATLEAARDWIGENF